ncbi:hypothetical protein ElyMa_000201800 [Elysia marginata]|uniref:Uncharacterized protein n=1 Tax=Elysia marginata TaxID=1093978 RepID=A0AAV4EWD8_9GAST|nr:hypothetical protein ElyMa_000201800 [Elysia marginata]
MGEGEVESTKAIGKGQGLKETWQVRSLDGMCAYDKFEADGDFQIAESEVRRGNGMNAYSSLDGEGDIQSAEVENLVRGISMLDDDILVMAISSNDDYVLDKYADDTVQIGLITDDDDSVYVEQKDAFINWCKNKYLVLNVGKTKEMILDFHKITSDPAYVKIDNKEVERVRSFKYPVHLKEHQPLRKDAPVKEVILWSDGAASQYKGKGNFAGVKFYPFKCQRNYFGSEHGKGEADGETGRFAQA